MTVEQVLHKLWSNSESKLEKHDEKRLWMLLQEFITQKGGLRADATTFDTKGGTKRLSEIKPSPQGLLSNLIRRATSG